MSETARPNMMLPALALLLLTLLAYIPALNAGYIWDDDDYLTDNTLIEDVDGLMRIWQPMQTRQYYPLVFTSFWIEHKLWGFEPFGFHLVNVLLHAMSAFLVWRIATWLKLPGAWVIAAVFALHPVHVESVAWVTERKNTLSGVLYLVAMLSFLRFDAQRRDGDAQWWRYALVLVCFMAALLSKSVTASLPVAIFLILLFKRESLSARRLWPLVPMLLLGLAMGLHTAHVERVNVGAVGPEFEFSFIERCLIASRALLFYPWKLLAPWPLCFFYERWDIDPGQASQFLPMAVVLVGVAALFWLWRRGTRWPACAVTFYAVTIFPALGFVSVYPMKYSFVADHFQYLASLGIIAGVVGALAWLLRAQRGRTGIAAVLLIGLGVLTFRQSLVYKNEQTLWRATIRCNPSAWIAMNNLSGALLLDAQELTRLGHHELASPIVREAESLLRDALRLRPDHDRARSQLSDALRVQGKLDEALREMEQAHEDLTRSLAGMDEAMLDRSRWSIAESHYKLARLYNLLERYDEAQKHYLVAASAFQPFPTALLELARIFAIQGNLESAAATYNNLLTMQPGVIEAHRFLGDYFRDQGEWPAALEHLQMIIETAPDQHERLRAMDRAARILATCPDESVRRGTEAIRLAETVVSATNREAVFPMQTLAAAYAEAGRFDEAVRVAEAAQQLAKRLDMPDLQPELAAQIESYRARQPWRTSPPADSHSPQGRNSAPTAPAERDAPAAR